MVPRELIPDERLVEQGAEFLVVDRHGNGSNCEEVLLPKSVSVFIQYLQQK